VKTTCEAQVTALPGGAVIRLSGDVDGTAADTLTAAYDQAVAEGDPASIVLDFASVGYINSTGRSSTSPGSRTSSSSSPISMTP